MKRTSGHRWYSSVSRKGGREVLPFLAYYPLMWSLECIKLFDLVLLDCFHPLSCQSCSILYSTVSAIHIQSVVRRGLVYQHICYTTYHSYTASSREERTGVPTPTTHTLLAVVRRGLVYQVRTPHICYTTYHSYTASSREERTGVPGVHTAHLLHHLPLIHC